VSNLRSTIAACPFDYLSNGFKVRKPFHAAVSKYERGKFEIVSWRESTRGDVPPDSRRNDAGMTIGIADVVFWEG
jgi:hypothetical protein